MTRKEQIVAVAARNFRQKGYRNTSLQDIADEVGIRKASLYYFFPSKEDLLLAVVKVPLEWLNEHIEQIIETETDPREQLRQAILSHASCQDLFRDANVVFQREDSTAFETLNAREYIIAGKRRYVDTWKQILAAGVVKGLFRQDLNVTVATFGVVEMVRGIVRWHQPGGHLSGVEIGHMFARIILNGLQPKPCRGGREHASRSVPVARTSYDGFDGADVIDAAF